MSKILSEEEKNASRPQSNSTVGLLQVQNPLERFQSLSYESYPRWLEALTPEQISNGPFPLREILTDSLYYPACGFDGKPVLYLAGNIYSFIYVDYSHTEDELFREFHQLQFDSYDILAKRRVSQSELTPNGWVPNMPSANERDPDMYRRIMKEPWCTWIVLQRKADRDERFGPARFSLLYLCADGPAAFQALYHSNRVAPKAVAVIAPGTGFGFNWTDFRVPNQIFGSSVLNNPHGRPEYLFYDFFPDGCWPGYEVVESMQPNDRLILARKN